MNMNPAITTELLAALQPLAGIPGPRLDALLPLCHQERFRQSLDPFRQRDWRGQRVYLMQGELKVTQPDGVIRVLVGGTERALFPVAQPGRMPTTARAITDVELLRLDERAVDIALTWDQCLPADVEVTDTPDWRRLLGALPLSVLTQGVFAQLPPAHIATLLARFERVHCAQGEVLVREGEPGDYYYLIEQGQCRVSRAAAETPLADLAAGDAFGEEALLAGAPRNATVSMATDGTLLRLRKDDFNTLLQAPLLQQGTAAEARQRVARGSLWLDVRTPAEYRHDGLPGAVNMPLPDLRAALAQLDPQREYVVYCQSGRRSAAAAFLMAQRGYKVVLLDGGLHALYLAESERRTS